MMTLPWFATVLGSIFLALSTNSVSAYSGFRLASSPAYRNSDPCPERCSISGPSTSNWSVYPDFKQIKHCQQTMFYDFSLYDNVDDEAENHHINACSSFGPDFSKLPSSTTGNTTAQPVHVNFQIGWWEEGFGLAASGLRSLIKQLRKYADNGHGATDRPFILFGQAGQATVGLYIGQGLLNEGLSVSALKVLEDNLDNLNVSTSSLAMQLCGPNYDSTHTFGIMATSNATFDLIQNAIKSWANATCLSFSGSTNITGQAIFTAPLVATNSTTDSSLLSGNITRLHSHHRHQLYHGMHPRAECRTVQVDSKDDCGKLATKCGISATAFTKYNSASDFCANLKPKQHVCCSTGTLPDFSPSSGADGTCYTYRVKTDDNCDDLASEFSLTRDKIEGFNKDTWGWNGCKLLFVGTNMCLSKGNAPFPAPIANAMCGPQKPGSKPPTDGSKITNLNPCPLNACCNIWGQCGITKDFCVDTNTGAPGTAKPGTYGCISNCGTDIVKGTGSGAIKIAYFEGYGMNRECLLQDASQIDTTQYTHIHFAFGTLTTGYEVETGDPLSTYQFTAFKRIKGAKRILSFGGWDFSTFPATYAIFRNGVTSANRLKMATNIANFIQKHDLDGVDIDWEYPGAPDLPGIPAASKDDGVNYLAFLVLLKNLLPGKSVSIAAPSSYWYLKQFPIKNIGKIVDYIVYMTYDLHGQWDAGNAYSQEGCGTGNCLRSQVNLTETKQSLAMITKAGVPGHKVIVGITSYGRSFNMAEAGCWGPGCVYTGSSSNSDATRGKCTGTAGYIADAEIADIINDRKRAGRVVKSFVDSSSNSDVLVYDDTQWVSYMSGSTKKTRSALYSAWGFGGTTDWASDLQTFNDVPKPAKSWADYKQLVKAGEDPRADHTRTGAWTQFKCTHPLIDDALYYTPSEQWNGLDANGAWRDVVRIWKDTDRDLGYITFSQSVSQTLNIGAGESCGNMTSNDCNVSRECGQGLDAKDSGAAGMLIWNSLVFIHHLHENYHTTLYQAASTVSNMLKDMENKFAPVAPPEDNTWKFFLIDLLTLGTLSAAGPFFNSMIKKMPYFATKDTNFNNAKDTTFTLVSQSTTMAKDLLSLGNEGHKWTLESQDAFSSYMGNVINGWGNLADFALERMFDGRDSSIDILWDAMSGGKLISGKPEDDTDFDPSPENMNETELRANIVKTIFGYSIPSLWKLSEAYAFIIDAGYSCDVNNPLSDYLDDDTMRATGACVDNKWYYIATPEGKSNECKCEFQGGTHCNNICRDQKFTAPKGLDSLDGSAFGGVTKEDLIKGAVNTYLRNGGKNGGELDGADATDKRTMDALLDVDITTPGFIRIPVCSPETAFQAWGSTDKGSSFNYPCDIPPGKRDCTGTILEDQTSDASASVSDCRKIIENIQFDATTEWTVDVAGKRQRAIAKSGSCAFGVEATAIDGNVNFAVGGQDVINIINSAIVEFGSSGKVGAKGNMDCKGNFKVQSVKWGLY